MYFSIVGNAMPARDFSKEVQGGNSIFRLGYADHFETHLLGKETDILILKTPAGDDDIFLRDTLYNTPIYDCSHLWFLHHRPKCLDRLKNLYTLHKKKISIIDRGWAIRQRKYLWDSFAAPFVPSFNIIVLNFLITEYPDIPKKVFCLDYYNNPAYNVAVEQTLLVEWEKNGDLEVVIND